jgi:4,5-DOPA dioxygenase extradiol
MARLPTLFIPHGGGPAFSWPRRAGRPDPWKPMGDHLRGLAAEIGQRPRAVLVISGHWEGPGRPSPPRPPRR